MLAKVVGTIVLAYSAFMILILTGFGYLTQSHPLSMSVALTEWFIPYTTAEIAIILVILYIWIPRKNKNKNL